MTQNTKIHDKMSRYQGPSSSSRARALRSSDYPPTPSYNSTCRTHAPPTTGGYYSDRTSYPGGSTSSYYSPSTSAGSSYNTTPRLDTQAGSYTPRAPAIVSTPSYTRNRPSTPSYSQYLQHSSSSGGYSRFLNRPLPLPLQFHLTPLTRYIHIHVQTPLSLPRTLPFSLLRTFPLPQLLLPN